MPETITQIQTINLPDGREAKLIVPELVQNLAIVDLKVLQRLTALLPRTNIGTIKDKFKNEMYHVDTMEQWVELLREELSFHESVNLISQISLNEVRPDSPPVRAVAVN